jgi:hypothetical protein
MIGVVFDASLEARWSASLPLDWDSWLLKMGTEGSFTQSSAWAQIHEQANHAAPYIVEVLRKGERVAGALFAYRPRDSGFARALIATIGGPGNFLECHGGPVIHDLNPVEAALVLLRETDVLARHLGVRAVRFVTPPPLASWTSASEIADAYRSNHYVQTPWETFMVDLARPVAEMLDSFRASARKGIRRCHDLGITIAECGPSEIASRFMAPLQATRLSMRQEMKPPAALVPWWEFDQIGAYHFFIAQDDARNTLATLGTYRWGGVATEILSERTPAARERKLPVQDLLHWHSFLRHRELGDRWFDLAGVNPHPIDAKEEGIRSFKKKWGAHAVAIPRYEKGGSSHVYNIIRRAIR